MAICASSTMASLELLARFTPAGVVSPNAALGIGDARWYCRRAVADQLGNVSDLGCREGSEPGVGRNHPSVLGPCACRGVKRESAEDRRAAQFAKTACVTLVG